MKSLFLEKIKSLCQNISNNYTLIFIAISFISFVFLINTILFVNIEPSEVNYYEAFVFVRFPDKRIELISYLTIIPLLFLLFFVYMLILKNKYKISYYTDIYTQKQKILSIFFLFLADTVLTIKMGRGLTYSIIIFIVWLTLNLHIFYINNFLNILNTIKVFLKKIAPNIKTISISFFQYLSKQSEKIYNIFEKTVILSLFAFCLFNLYYLFVPLIQEKLYIHREIPIIPLKIKIYDEQDRSKMIYFDEIEAAEKMHIFGYRKFYDIRNPKKSLDGINCVNVSNSEELKNVLNSIIDKIHIMSKYQKTPFSIYNYFYKEGNQICSIGKLTKTDIQILDDKLNTNINLKKEFQKVIRNNEAIPDIVKNDRSTLENRQAMAIADVLSVNNRYSSEGRWWHHHNHILSAIIKHMHGEKTENIFMQYGYGTSLTINKIMSLMNGYNIGNYYNIINSVYLIYYAAFFIMLLFIFKNPLMSASVFGITLFYLDMFPYEHFYIAPGANPIRHFADVFVITAFFGYLKYNKKWLLTLVPLFVVGGIFLYPMNGLFLGLAVAATLFIHQFIKRNSYETVIFAITFLFSLVSYKIFSAGLNLELGSFFDGVCAQLSTKPVLCIIYGLFIFSYFLILKNLNKQNPYNELFLFLILYVQGVALYYITISEITHFLVFAPIYVFTLFVGLILVRETFNIKENSFDKLYLVLCITLIFILSLQKYPVNKGMKNEFKNFWQYYDTQNWTIEGTNFDSVIESKYVEDSINLLKNSKYAQSDYVYIISEADNMLLPIAQKSNAVKYIDFQWYISQPKIYEEVKQQFLAEKPKYVFVDNILTSDKLETIVKNEARQDRQDLYLWLLRRYHRLQIIQKLSREVLKDYEPVESSYLLTVWERKDK